MKIKGLLPALRERKRYIAFEIISKSPIKSFESVSKSIWSASLDFIGVLGCSKAGIIIPKEKYQDNNGIIRINNRYIDQMRSALSTIQMIDNQKIIIKTIGTSGILKKAVAKMTLTKN